MYAVFITTVTQWTSIIDPLLAGLLYMTLRNAGYYGESVDDDLTRQRNLVWLAFSIHWFFSKTIKLVPHLIRNPGDVLYVPVSIGFGYYHNWIKLKGMLSLQEVCNPRTRYFRLGLTLSSRPPGAPERAPMSTTRSGCSPRKRCSSSPLLLLPNLRVSASGHRLSRRASSEPLFSNESTRSVWHY